MQALNFTEIDQMPDKVLTIFLPAVDAYIINATGKDWGTLTDTYTTIDPLSKLTAGILLARWFEDASQVGQVNDLGVLSMIGQLQAKSLKESQAAT